MTNFRRTWQRIEPFWYPIAVFMIASIAVFVYHLQTGFTPDRVALNIQALDLAVYWYGILIIGGVALGSYVVSYLAGERAQRLFVSAVPLAIRQRPLRRLKLPAEIAARLRKQGVDTLGILLFQRGLNPANLGLKREQLEELEQQLDDSPDIQQSWLNDAPWRQWNPDRVWNGVVWCLILGIIGARLYHVLTPSPSMAEVGIFSPSDYFRHPLQLINLRRGGLGIYGGIAGGLLGLLLYTRRHRLNTLAWADLSAVGLALGQFIGRWGNFVNQELYGRPTELPWAVRIDPIHRLSGYTDTARFHPAFLYESLWNFLSFAVLMTLLRRYRNRLKAGDVAGLYLIFYAIGRTLLETVRLDSRTVSLAGFDLNIAIATAVSLVIAVVVAILIIVRHRQNSEPQTV